MIRPFPELVHPDDAFPLIREWSATAPHPVEILPRTPEAGQRTLEALQVSTRSPMGALAYHTGGILLDHGWLRILGAGSDQLPRALDRWNGLDTHKPRCERGILVADDALGGFFSWFREPSTIHYFAPDTFEWEDLALGYTDWLEAMCTDKFTGFYAELRGNDWQREVAGLEPHQGFHVYPPLMMRSETPRSRKPVPMEELWQMGMELGREIAGLPDGAQVRVGVEKT